MWKPEKLPFRLRNVIRTFCANYSRRSDSKNADSYKVIKPRKTVDDSPNWELLAPRDYRFYLPGSIGLAWHDAHTTAHLEEFRSISSHLQTDSKASAYAVECVAHECPVLLRRGVLELFPGIEIGGSELTVVTISQKTTTDLSCTDQEVELEREKLTKFFVVAAQEICQKLRLAGYWADFVNPFSGRPYFAPYHSALYETEEKAYSLDFHINDSGFCKVISSDHQGSHSFFGSLFTTAPASTTLLKDVLEQYD